MADESPDELRMKTFLVWCKENNLNLNTKVKVCKRGSCHRYGMIATDDIHQDECLFSIPRNLLLEPKTCSIADVIQDLGEEFQQIISDRGSGWIPLLLALMYEFTNATSFWRPYLDIVPGLEILDQPMFWSKEDRERLLKDTEIGEDVEQDLKCIEKEYHKVVKTFIKSHQENFSTKTHTLDLYKHMAAFVMAYSFTENSPGCQGNNAPVMVPMADILNHHSNNNAHLEYEKDELRMVSTQPIAKGQEVYNTYGQLANCHLLQSYGFVEQTPNPNDTIEIPLSIFYEVLQQHVSSKHEARLLDAKFQFMEEMGLVSDDDGFVFDIKGCQICGTDLSLFMQFLHLTDPELHVLLNPEDKDESLTSDLTDLMSHFEQCNEEQKTSSCELLAKALKSRKRTNHSVSNEEIQRNYEHPLKKLRSGRGDFNNELSGIHNDLTSSDEHHHNDCTDDNSNSDNDDVNDDDADNDADDNDGGDCDDDGDDTDDGGGGDDDDISDGDSDDDDDTVCETQEEEQIDHVTYEQMSEYPLKWRQTLCSVSKDCSSKIDSLLREKEIDVEDMEKLTSRQQAIKHMLYGLKDILQSTCELATTRENSEQPS